VTKRWTVQGAMFKVYDLPATVEGQESAYRSETGQAHPRELLNALHLGSG